MTPNWPLWAKTFFFVASQWYFRMIPNIQKWNGPMNPMQMDLSDPDNDKKNPTQSILVCLASVPWWNSLNDDTWCYLSSTWKHCKDCECWPVSLFNVVNNFTTSIGLSFEVLWANVQKVKKSQRWLFQGVLLMHTSLSLSLTTLFLAKECFLITPIKCLKGPGCLCVFQNQSVMSWLSEWQSHVFLSFKMFITSVNINIFTSLRRAEERRKGIIKTQKLMAALTWVNC